MVISVTVACLVLLMCYYILILNSHFKLQYLLFLGVKLIKNGIATETTPILFSK